VANNPVTGNVPHVNFSIFVQLYPALAQAVRGAGVQIPCSVIIFESVPPYLIMWSSVNIISDSVSLLGPVSSPFNCRLLTALEIT